MTSATAAIDVHCHLFTAMDIPVHGFFHGRGVPVPITELIEKTLLSLPIVDQKTPSEGTGSQDARFFQMLKRRDPSLVVPKKYAAWIRVLAQSTAELAAQMVAIYPATGLFVPLTVDLEYWLDGQPIRPFPRQLEVVAETIDRHPGRIHPFIAFNPERARRDYDEPEEALEPIREAVFKRGFIGIKLYPSLGFRPLGNNRRRPKPPHAETYDRLLTALYDFCQREQVPITAHCTNRGVKGGPGKGRLGHPKYWQRVLEAYPDLHLNLAHFGGDRHLSRSGKVSWSETIAELIGRFDHVYGDTAHHKRACRERSRDRLFDGLERISNRHPRVLDRLMFGTDWHILAIESCSTDYAAIYREQYQSRFGKAASHALFSENAKDFLGLLPGGKNRDRLLEYYRARDRRLPEWLQQGP